MKILVTGGAGFIGSHLVERLLEEGHQVTVYDNFNKYYTGKEQSIKGFGENPNCTIIRGDILDPGALEKAASGCEVIFHQAAQAGVRYSIEHPLETNRINVEGTLNTLETARKQEIKKIIFASSSSVYGSAHGKPMEEDQPKHPESPYGASKLACETYCGVYSRLYGIDIPLLRYFTVYGPRQRPDMAIRIFIEKMLRGGSPVVFGDGGQSRDFTYISDIIDANISILRTGLGGCEAYNLAGGSTVSVNDLLAELSTIVGKGPAPQYSERKRGDVLDTIADTSKAEKHFGYEPKVSLSDGLTQMVEWCKAGHQKNIPRI